MLGCPPQSFKWERNKLLYCLSHRYLGSPFLAAEPHANGFRNTPLAKKGYYKGKAIWKTLGPEPRARPDCKALLYHVINQPLQVAVAQVYIVVSCSHLPNGMCLSWVVNAQIQELRVTF